MTILLGVLLFLIDEDIVIEIGGNYAGANLPRTGRSMDLDPAISFTITPVAVKGVPAWRQFTADMNQSSQYVDDSGDAYDDIVQAALAELEAVSTDLLDEVQTRAMDFQRQVEAVNNETEEEYEFRTTPQVDNWASAPDPSSPAFAGAYDDSSDLEDEDDYRDDITSRLPVPYYMYITAQDSSTCSNCSPWHGDTFSSEAMASRFGSAEARILDDNIKIYNPMCKGGTDCRCTAVLGWYEWYEELKIDHRY
jgi:hypothetical protein